MDGFDSLLSSFPVTGAAMIGRVIKNEKYTKYTKTVQ